MHLCSCQRREGDYVKKNLGIPARATMTAREMECQTTNAARPGSHLPIPKSFHDHSVKSEEGIVWRSTPSSRTIAGTQPKDYRFLRNTPNEEASDRKPNRPIKGSRLAVCGSLSGAACASCVGAGSEGAGSEEAGSGEAGSVAAAVAAGASSTTKTGTSAGGSGGLSPVTVLVSES